MIIEAVGPLYRRPVARMGNPPSPTPEPSGFGKVSSGQRNATAASTLLATVPWLSPEQNQWLTPFARNVLSQVRVGTVADPASAFYSPFNNTMYVAPGQSGGYGAFHEGLHAYESYVPPGFSAALTFRDKEVVAGRYGDEGGMLSMGWRSLLTGQPQRLPARVGQAAVIGATRRLQGVGYDPAEAYASLGQFGPGGIRQGLRQFYPFESSAYARPSLATRQLRGGTLGGPIKRPLTIEELQRQQQGY